MKWKREFAAYCILEFDWFEFLDRLIQPIALIMQSYTLKVADALFNGFRHCRLNDGRSQLELGSKIMFGRYNLSKLLDWVTNVLDSSEKDAAFLAVGR